MFSYGEIVVTLAAAIALFGPKDIPIVARAAGRFVGKAVGYVQSARGQLGDVMKRSQVEQIQKELQETMAQLEAIQYEIRSGMSISNPGPLTRSVLKMDQKPASPSLSSTQIQTVEGALKPKLQSNVQRVSETQEHRTAVFHPTIPHLESGDFETRDNLLDFQPGPDGTFNTMPASTSRIDAHRKVLKPIGVAPAASPQSSANSKEMQDICVLPISAVSAGILPARIGPLSDGADLVLESLTERKVAFDTVQFLDKADQY